MNVHPSGHSRLPLPFPMRRAPPTITMNESPSKMQPIAIFDTLDGSVPRFACHAQNMSSGMPKMKMMNGLNDWNQVDGILNPRIVGQRVFSSAHVCIELPC